MEPAKDTVEGDARAAAAAAFQAELQQEIVRSEAVAAAAASQEGPSWLLTGSLAALLAILLVVFYRWRTPRGEKEKAV